MYSAHHSEKNEKCDITQQHIDIGDMLTGNHLYCDFCSFGWTTCRYLVYKLQFILHLY